MGQTKTLWKVWETEYPGEGHQLVEAATKEEAIAQAQQGDAEVQVQVEPFNLADLHLRLVEEVEGRLREMADVVAAETERARRDYLLNRKKA